MACVSVGMDWEFWKTGEVSVRVEDDEGVRVYKIRSADIGAIYESIRREVLAEVRREEESVADDEGKCWWHLEHGDGTRWTSRELDEIVRRKANEYEAPPWTHVDRLLLDQYGVLWIRDTGGRVHCLDGEDMEVARGL